MKNRIEIVGGGLAGLSLGLALRREGVPVTLYEAMDYPRHRVCGEFITGLDKRTIAQLRLEPALRHAKRHHEVAWFIGERLTRVESLPSPAFGISRHALDLQLANAFVAAGGDLHTDTRIADDAPRPGRVYAAGRRRGHARWLGLKVHVHGLPMTRDLELHLGREAYVGVSAVENGALNVCGLFRQRPTIARKADGGRDAVQILFDYLRDCGLVAFADRLGAASVDSDSFCAVAALSFDRGEAPTDRITIGDAYEMTPPFTGNGMAMAFQSAAIAVEPLVAYARSDRSWTAASAAITAAIRTRFRRRLASADVIHSFLLRPRRQRWISVLSQARLLPFRSLYAAVH